MFEIITENDMNGRNWTAYFIIGILALGVIIVGLAVAFFFFLPIVGVLLLGLIVYYVVRMIGRIKRDRTPREGTRVMKSSYTVLDDEKQPPGE